MATPQEIEDAMVASVMKPKKVKTETAEVEQQDPTAVLDVLKNIAGKAAASSPNSGLKFAKFRHQSTQGPRNG